MQVRELLLRQSVDLDGYLAAVGVHSPGLLPASAQAALAVEEQRNESALGRLLEAVGQIVGGCGCWLKDRFQVCWLLAVCTVCIH